MNGSDIMGYVQEISPWCKIVQTETHGSSSSSWWSYVSSYSPAKTIFSISDDVTCRLSLVFISVVSLFTVLVIGWISGLVGFHNGGMITALCMLLYMLRAHIIRYIWKALLSLSTLYLCQYLFLYLVQMSDNPPTDMSSKQRSSLKHRNLLVRLILPLTSLASAVGIGVYIARKDWEAFTQLQLQSSSSSSKHPAAQEAESAQGQGVRDRRRAVAQGELSSEAREQCS